MKVYHKFKADYQSKWKGKNLYDSEVLKSISRNVKLHDQTLINPRSSAAACLNVLGSLRNDPNGLKEYLNQFGLQIEEIIEFPTMVDLGGEVYDDRGYVVFEWMGPKNSPIYEIGGGRGDKRTSIDAFVLAVIAGKVTQLLIEWKFTESYLEPEYLNRFAGIKGIERLRRYTSALADLKKTKTLPLKMETEGGWGLNELGYEPLYQLLRMTLLAKKTTPLILNENLLIEDYRIVHLTHSQNSPLNLLPQHVIAANTCGLMSIATSLHQLWSENILTDIEAEKFKFGYWDKHLKAIPDSNLSDYLIERYV